jgi:hypothetical protein
MIDSTAHNFSRRQSGGRAHMLLAQATNAGHVQDFGIRSGQFIMINAYCNLRTGPKWKCEYTGHLRQIPRLSLLSPTPPLLPLIAVVTDGRPCLIPTSSNAAYIYLRTNVFCFANVQT